MTVDASTGIQLIQLEIKDDLPSTVDPISKTMTLTVNVGREWHLYVLGKYVTQGTCPALNALQPQLDCDSAKTFLEEIGALTICPGNTKPTYIDLVKRKHGMLVNPLGEKTVEIDSKSHMQTVRHTNCHMLIKANEAQCLQCRLSKKMMQMRVARAKGQPMLTYLLLSLCIYICTYITVARIARQFGETTNWKHLTTPQKRQQHERKVKAARKWKRKATNLEKRVTAIMMEREVIVDNELDASLSPALQDYHNAMQKLPTTDIKRIFWEQ